MAEHLIEKNTAEIREDAQAMVRGQRFLEGVRTLFNGLEGDVLHHGATNRIELTFDERTSEVTFFPVSAIKTWLQHASYKGPNKFSDMEDAKLTTEPFYPRQVTIHKDIYTGIVVFSAKSDYSYESWGITRLRTDFELGDCTMSIKHIVPQEQPEP